jgi:hypothetical protein
MMMGPELATLNITRNNRDYCFRAYQNLTVIECPPSDSEYLEADGIVTEHGAFDGEHWDMSKVEILLARYERSLSEIIEYRKDGGRSMAQLLKDWGMPN